jgi:hypothetical protein
MKSKSTKCTIKKIDSDNIAMISKEEAIAFAIGQFDAKIPPEKHGKWHYGRVDVKELLDFIYDRKYIVAIKGEYFIKFMPETEHSNINGILEVTSEVSEARRLNEEDARVVINALDEIGMIGLLIGLPD